MVFDKVMAKTRHNGIGLATLIEQYGILEGYVYYEVRTLYMVTPLSS